MCLRRHNEYHPIFVSSFFLSRGLSIPNVSFLLLMLFLRILSSSKTVAFSDLHALYTYLLDFLARISCTIIIIDVSRSHFPSAYFPFFPPSVEYAMFFLEYYVFQRRLTVSRSLPLYSMSVFYTPYFNVDIMR